MRLGKNKMQGLLSLDDDDLRANDATVGIEDGQTLKSSIVPYEMTAKGAVSSKTNGISREDMKTVIDYSMYAAADTAKKILNGEFDCEPAKVGNKINACEYCNFKGICHFNEDVEGYKIKDLHHFETSKNEEIIKLMQETLEKKGDA
jgi:ATP-dependent helicase/nuclease subunit B